MIIYGFLAKLFGIKHWKDKSYDKDLLHGMNKNARKEFLSNDLIERMIQVEQRVSAHFGTFLNYDKTDYYKSLRNNEREDFERYLKSKQKKKIVVFLMLVTPILILGLLNISFTGNIVKENFEDFGFMDYLLIFVIFGFFIYLTISVLLKRYRYRRFRGHFEILTNVLGRKYLNNNKEGINIGW